MPKEDTLHPHIYDELKEWISPHSSILELGCGDGTLLHSLSRDLNLTSYGLEIGEKEIQLCLEKDLNVIENNIDTDLHNYDENCFDTILVKDGLHYFYSPDNTLKEMLRIGGQIIVIFHNYGYLKTRLHFVFSGSYIHPDDASRDWYKGRSLKPFSIVDFENLCDKLNIQIRKRVFHGLGSNNRFLPNLTTKVAAYLLSN